MTPPLKPCPFCRGTHLEICEKEELLADATTPDDIIVFYYVECIACEARGPLMGSTAVAMLSWSARADEGT